jgi:hypothetical protein
MTDNVDFWCILFGIVSTAIVLGGIYGFIELADARQHARYRRAQQDRVKGRGFIHGEGQ